MDHFLSCSTKERASDTRLAQHRLHCASGDTKERAGGSFGSHIACIAHLVIVTVYWDELRGLTLSGSDSKLDVKLVGGDSQLICSLRVQDAPRHLNSWPFVHALSAGPSPVSQAAMAMHIR